MPISEVFNMDCLDFIKGLPDKAFSLAIPDPPYGIGFGEFNRTNKDSNGNRYKADKYKNGNWDSESPTEEYFKELIRVSENQIVWGGNYYQYLAKRESPNLKTIEQFNEYINSSTEKWLFWYKQNPVPNFADGELAWTSYPENKQFDYRYYGNLEGNTSATDKIHPTQKPITLYKWILQNYAKPGDKILDTHMGSQSSRIAAYDMGFDYWGCELDKDYFAEGNKRFELFKSQGKLFTCS